MVNKMQALYILQATYNNKEVVITFRGHRPFIKYLSVVWSFGDSPSRVLIFLGVFGTTKDCITNLFEYFLLCTITIHMYSMSVSNILVKYSQKHLVQRQINVCWQRQVQVLCYCLALVRTHSQRAITSFCILTQSHSC